MDLGQEVGRNVQRLRVAAGISLVDLAAAACISKTTLHGIEQGQGNPTLSTLWALATALAVPLGELLETSAPATEVVRAGDDRPRVQGDAVTARLLHRVKLRGTLEVFDIEVAQRSQFSEPHLPGVEECIVLTSGHLTTGPSDATADLRAHDSIRFDASRPHVYRGLAERNRAVLLMLHSE